MGRANLSRRSLFDVNSVLVNTLDGNQKESFHRVRTQPQLLAHSEGSRTDQSVDDNTHTSNEKIVGYIELGGTFFGVNMLGDAALGL